MYKRWVSFLKANKSRIVIFLICCLLSFLFWGLTVFSKNYETVIEFPLRYINIPSNQILINQPPKTVALLVESFGFNLLFYKLFNTTDTLEISTDRFRQRFFGTKSFSFVSPESLLNKASGKVVQNIKIKKFLTDTIFFFFDEKIDRLIPIQFNYTIDYKKQFLASGPTEIKPTAVHIIGPRIMIDTLKFISNKSIVFSQVDKTLSGAAALETSQLDEFCQIKPQKFLYTIPVEKFTERMSEIPITIENIPEGYDAKLFPSSVKIKYNIPFSQYEKVADNMFKVAVDFNSSTHQQNKMRVEITHAPEAVEITSISPKRVEYIIRKKDSK